MSRHMRHRKLASRPMTLEQKIRIRNAKNIEKNIILKILKHYADYYNK